MHSKINVSNGYNIDDCFNMLGHISPNEAFDLVKNSGAILVDVRTPEELLVYGHPFLPERNGKKVYYNIPLKDLSSMEFSQDFIPDLIKNFEDNWDLKLLFICEAGIRSEEAAGIAKQLGFDNSLNVFGGVSSRPENSSAIGWKTLNLPWKTPTFVE